MTDAPRTSERSDTATAAPGDDWRSTALPLEDLTQLEPPEPLEHILLACDRLPQGAVYCARLRHTPTPLFPHLEIRHLEWWSETCADGSALVWIRSRST